MKVQIKERNAMYPLPVTLVGANVDGKANFITIAHVGIFALDMVTMGISKTHYTNKGIIENRTFSVNIPSEDMVVETDYAGLVSGKNNDKSSLFEVAYGVLETAPMIVRAPVCMECELVDVVDCRTHDGFIGRVAAIHAEERVITDGTIDLRKVKPMLFDMHRRKYWRLGEPFADCWSVGKTLKGKE